MASILSLGKVKDLVKPFLDLQDAIYSSSSARVIGGVRAIVGLTLTVGGLGSVAGIGSLCRVHGQKGAIEGEVVGAQGSDLCLLPFGNWEGVAVGDQVALIEHDNLIFPDESWIGTVIDALGRPLSEHVRARRPRKKSSATAHPPSAFERKQVGEKLETQIKCVDIFTPICKGQRMGVFAGSGVGKSTLMAMLARNTDADVIVIGLV